MPDPFDALLGCRRGAQRECDRPLTAGVKVLVNCPTSSWHGRPAVVAPRNVNGAELPADGAQGAVIVGVRIAGLHGIFDFRAVELQRV